MRKLEARHAQPVRRRTGKVDLRQPAGIRENQRGHGGLLRTARARFARLVARTNIHNNTGALPQPPSGERAPLNPERAAEYVRATVVYAQGSLPCKVFSLSPLTQYILDPLAAHRPDNSNGAPTPSEKVVGALLSSFNL